MAKKDIGTNIKAEFKGSKLILETETDQSFGRTKKGEGKNVIIASTQGSVKLYDDKNKLVIISINIYRPPQEGE